MEFSREEKINLAPRTTSEIEWVDAEKLREVVADHHIDMSEELMEALGALLPAPPAPRTMAEIEWDDEEHQGLEAVYLAGTTWESVVRMLYPMDRNDRDGIVCVEKSGRVFNPYPRDLTPLSGTKINLAPEPASPRHEDVPVGEAWQVEVNGRAAIGYRNDPEDMICWTVVYRDEADHDWMHDGDVTLIARLVPETTGQDDAPAQKEETNE